MNSSIALVTGAAAGIGRATALAYAKAGCDVVISDIQRDRLVEVEQAITKLGRKALSVVADMSVESDIRTLHADTLAYFGRLDYACNNAGIEGENAPTHESSLENFDRTLAVNLRGVFICMQEQLKLMLTQGSGAIVNISSVAGLIGFPNLPAYCASKGGVIQLTKAAAVEYAEHNIRVNAVCPGVIHTDMIDRVTGRDPEIEAQYAAFHPMNRMGTVEEVADTIVFLSLPQSGFITGQALAVDGGMVAR
ncbi:MAG: glucose 1-dehydrogenase [Idiomarina sp.]|nr:glucose 1-dehydrogenase [Idiomarina sp.]